MICFQTVLFLVLLFLVVITIIVLNIENGYQLEKDFDDFIFKFNKSYKRYTPEYDRRFILFKRSIDEINLLNSLRIELGSAQFGPTQFSDLSPIEFKNEILRKSRPKRSFSPRRIINLENNKDLYDVEVSKDNINSVRRRRHLDGLPEKVDWRGKGVISPVQNQGMCGSCWAYSVIENIESMVAIKKNVSIVEQLSPQQMIDCAGNNNFGCLGGDTCNLLEWLYEEEIPIETLADYPASKKMDETCHMETVRTIKSGPIVVKNYTCSNLVEQENTILEYLSEIGPVVAGVNAQLWQNYLGGVIQFHCDGDFTNLNHAVQIVGFDRSGDIPFYIVRNSWGRDFGDNGYVKIEIGRNLCGIANQISLVDVEFK